MNLGNHNIRAFCVTLQELPEKWEFISKHFSEVGVQCEQFNGISAAESGLMTQHCYEVDNPGSGWHIGSKEVATWLSFYSLWSAMLYMPENHFWQLEWDCHFAPDWRIRVEQALKDVPPDFDLLYVGSCCTKDKPRTHVKGEVYEMNQMHCGHATIIAKKALPVMLRTQRRVYAPIDLSLMFHTFPQLKCYVILPRVADQFNTVLPE